MASRHIPEKIKSLLLQEAGYRCGVPTCNETNALTFEHIEDWAKLEIKEHDFDKMIVLCSNCHHRVTYSKDIPKSAVVSYKRNLQVVNGRYSRFEMRFLSEMRGQESIESTDSKFSFSFAATRSDLIHLSGFLNDGLVELKDIPADVIGLPNHLSEKMIRHVSIMQNKPIAFVVVTEKGRLFANKYFDGIEI